MSKNILILFSIVFPIISGFVLLCYPKVKDRKKIQIYMLKQHLENIYSMRKI